MKILHHISRLNNKKGIGNKAVSLFKMQKLGLPVPLSYVIPNDIRAAFLDDPEQVREQILKELDQISQKDCSWAIRSSGDMEDLGDHSFAGQFSTFLKVKGSPAMLEAIEKVWESVVHVREGSYINESEKMKGPSGMSVIIQEMVDPKWSGVAFSINPVTGRNEFVFEAVKGSGVQLVQDGARPFRWTWFQDGWEAGSAPEEEIKKELGTLVDGLKVLGKTFGAAVDVEWVYDGINLFYLQCRPVTVNEFPTIYSNHISREVLPGMIKPLVWSVNIPLVNSAWIRLLERLLGRLNITPDQLSKSFYYRAYFNMGTLGILFSRMGLPKDSLESLMGRKSPSGKSSFKPSLRTMRYLPSMLAFVLSNLFLKRKFQKKFSHIAAQTDSLMQKIPHVNPADFYSCFEELNSIASEAAYYNILIPLSFQISNRVLLKKLKKRRIPFEQLDFAKDFPELSDYDPSEHLSRLQRRWSSLPADVRNRLKNLDAIKSEQKESMVRELWNELEALIKQFGHFSESGNDFSATPWREDPEFVFNQVRLPFETSTSSVKKSTNFTFESRRIPRRAYLRAGRYRLYREMISSEYTRCYGLFRDLFLVTGKSFQKKGWLEEPKDVFYLTLEQHNQLLGNIPDKEAKSYGRWILNVKKEMDDYGEVILPSVIYGDTPPPMPRKNEEVLEGIPTSPGIFEGELVVVKGYEDFKKDVQGNILVIPYSDVGWTPLLVRAGAIVSESGGMLSHASIIARELAIPAISSIDHACNLQDGTKAIIDGTNGKLFINR